MKEPSATDSFIICMRENNEHAMKLPRIPPSSIRNRKIRGHKKAYRPNERNDKEYDQEDHHRFLPAFSIQVTAVALLEYLRNETLCAMHIFNVRLTDGLAERL